ncbi:hypothetical protein LTR16_000287 [Cryomyces antarcticus]|uniref:Pisatin demethylase n=1 Tax=Cryomyces antarcticus TaxID=329879 RepID=A0ABR0MAZ0_9PEZI|nr:hypothetical protein LTR16_000287 [Cryomyces antarcticus]
MHPAAGLILERIVPPQGIDICGEHIPGGTIVGCNAWVLHRRPEIFGADVDACRPERWIDAPPAQLKEMKATMFQFGAGARTCIGKNISLLEVYKLVPSFLRRLGPTGEPRPRVEDAQRVVRAPAGLQHDLPAEAVACDCMTGVVESGD